MDCEIWFLSQVKTPQNQSIYLTMNMCKRNMERKDPRVPNAISKEE